MSGMNYSLLYQRIVNAYSAIPMHLLPGYTLPPLQVFFEITYRCNLSCDFCQFLQDRDPAEFAVRQPSEELSITELNDIVRALPRSAVISFTGGEPFVKPGFMELLGSTSKRNKTHIFTNGTKVDDRTAGLLVGLGARSISSPGLILVGISLEGLEDVHDRIVRRPRAFQRTIEGVQAIVGHRTLHKRRYPLVELKTVISAKNAAQLYQIYLLAKELGVDVFNVMAMSTLPQAGRACGCAEVSLLQPPSPVQRVDAGVLKDQLERIHSDASESTIQIRTTPQGFDFEAIMNHYGDRRRLSDYRCYYPWYGAGISAYGDVIICPYVVAGNVRQDTVKTLLNNRRCRDFRKQLKARKIFPGCWGCCMLVPRNGTSTAR